MLLKRISALAARLCASKASLEKKALTCNDDFWNAINVSFRNAVYGMYPVPEYSDVLPTCSLGSSASASYIASAVMASSKTLLRSSVRFEIATQIAVAPIVRLRHRRRQQLDFCNCWHWS